MHKEKLSSRDTSEGKLAVIELEIGDTSMGIETMTRIGGPNKRFNEDDYLILAVGSVLKAILVDGGTQVEKVPSLEAIGLSGGKYIATKVVEFAAELELQTSIEEDLRVLDQRIRSDEAINHPAITHEKDSKNGPYASIAGVKFDSERKRLEIANAGDVFVVTIDHDGIPVLHTRDDIYKNDRRVFAKAKTVANEQGITIREAIEKALKNEEPRILNEMYETMRKGNTREVKRINGADNFAVSSAVSLDTTNISEVWLFCDGAIPVGINIRPEEEGLDEELQEQEGLVVFANLVKEEGIPGIDKEVRERSKADPKFEKARFRDVDDFTFIRMKLSQN